VLRFANHVEMRFKHSLACKRPNEYSPQVQPMILTPGHGTLPSGHATEAFISALVLWKLLQASGSATYAASSFGEQLMRLAARIAINRTVAGVHFPVDSMAGAMLGLTLGNYLLARFRGDASYAAWRFDGASFPASPSDGDFYWTDLYDASTDAQHSAGVVSGFVTNSATPSLDPTRQSPALSWLWGKALAEWS